MSQEATRFPRLLYSLKGVAALSPVVVGSLELPSFPWSLYCLKSRRSYSGPAPRLCGVSRLASRVSYEAIKKLFGVVLKILKNSDGVIIIFLFKIAYICV